MIISWPGVCVFFYCCCAACHLSRIKFNEIILQMHTERWSAETKNGICNRKLRETYTWHDVYSECDIFFFTFHFIQSLNCNYAKIMQLQCGRLVTRLKVDFACVSHSILGNKRNTLWCKWSDLLCHFWSASRDAVSFQLHHVACLCIFFPLWQETNWTENG